MTCYIGEEYDSFFKLIDNDFYLKFTKKQFPEGHKKYKNVLLKKLDSEKLEESFNKEYEFIDITYSIDEYGYRIYPKLNRPTNKNIFCFGCSYTFGHGIPDEHTWPYILAKKLGEDYTPHNYGVPASSIKSMGRRLYQVLNLNPIKPDHVFLFLPDIFRNEYIGNIGDAPIYIDLCLNFHKAFNTLQAIEELRRRKRSDEPNNDIRTLWYAYTSVMNSYTTVTLLPTTVYGTASGNYDGSSQDFYGNSTPAANYYAGQGNLQTIAKWFYWQIEFGFECQK